MNKFIAMVDVQQHKCIGVTVLQDEIPESTEEMLYIEVEDHTYTNRMYENGEWGDYAVEEVPNNTEGEPTPDSIAGSIKHLEEQGLTTLEALADIYEDRAASKLENQEALADIYEMLLQMMGG